MSVSVKINLKPLERYLEAIRQGGLYEHPVISRMFKQWSFRYRAFAEERFVQHSYGGGDKPWATLKKSTKKKRRNKTTFSILWDTGLLLGALDTNVGARGSTEERIPFGIRVGYGGPHKHPEGKATIADIASFHQKGNKRRGLPARKIIVVPPQEVINEMAEDGKRALDELKDG